MNSRICVATASPEATQDMAATLAETLADGDLLVLAGDLGAGKTCFTQGLGRGLGIDQRITSPTFTLANRYHGRLTLDHLDVYRIDTLADTLDLDLPELLEDGVTVIEWGEQILPALPADYLHISLLLGSDDDDRRIDFTPMGSEWQGRVTQLQAALKSWEIPC
ncbi:MAG: tRNA threonylcarbamoyladenosine biosynthesis protein TsaE [Acidimicrobiales bacterium]|jgi:tRNA threonylcarbamoyladenosine biosynthesis protein TsaE